MVHETKLFEVRDEGTCISVLAVRIRHDPAQVRGSWIVGRVGYRGTYVLLTNLTDRQTETDPNEWTRGRTLRLAHRIILTHWNALEDGELVDVRPFADKASHPCETECPLPPIGDR